MGRHTKPKVKCICKKCEVEFYTRPSEVREFCSGPCAQQYKGIDRDWLIKRNATNLEKYGDEVSFRSPQVQSLFKSNLKEKYGVENPFLVEEFRNKSHDTMVKKYGYKFAIQNPEIALKVSEALKGKIPNMFKNFHQKKWEQLMDYYKMSKMLPLFEKEDFISNRVGNLDNKWKFRCDLCGKEDEYTLINNYMPVCSCNKKSISSIEEEIKTFLLQYIPESDLFFNKRTILGNGKELDIYIPSYNLAIELNGIFWHSETCGKDRKYHLNKTEICLDKNIHLFHIIDQEWMLKKEIIKSMLLNKIGRIASKIHARKCVIREIPNDILKEFLNNNHIQGYTHSSVNIGLFYNDELTSVMTFGKNRFKKDSNEWELVRFCNKLNTSVIGGASKLFQYFIKNYNQNNLDIISFSDRRFFMGGLYKNLGFIFDKFTSPSYIYWKGNKILNRMTCQKHKLPKLLDKFDIELSEYVNMKNNGYNRLWDCGNSRWIFKSNCERK